MHDVTHETRFALTDVLSMARQAAAIGLAGFIGSGVAVIHGVLIQRLMITPYAIALVLISFGVSA
ncbi:hypothetical protein DUT91_20250 [Phyllobacterium salinisoli]|uniref:Uncharacterized protein n=1 Tax=Phyllobacterium salinisoli TaxID=1899321 RepID=A0A368JY48_9HYPH|nr:hypothetical protein DUT91_20250 [Phyllobacterium salinisoli]